MTSSELAFLGLGLLLGAATGAAFAATLAPRLQRREIRVTVTRDAVPRRSATLSHDALLARDSGPAPGGPGDRRWLEREPIPAPAGSLGPDAGRLPWAPVARPITSPDDDLDRAPVRTSVPFFAGAVAIPIEPEPDPELDDILRRPAPPATLERMLRGDLRALVEVVDRIAGEDPWRRREWEILLGGLIDGLAAVAVRESVIDFPMGTAFWDALTVEQCRRVVSALASMGYRYDGRSGWVANRVPTYRELSQAVADIEVDPRRLRAWPSQAEIAALFVGARPAAEELLPAAGPAYEAEDVRALLGDGGPDLGNLWLAWDAVRPILFQDRRVREPVEV